MTFIAIYLAVINIIGYAIMGFSVSDGAPGGSPGLHRGHAAFPPQDKALVLQIRHARHLSGSGGTAVLYT